VILLFSMLACTGASSDTGTGTATGTDTAPHTDTAPVVDALGLPEGIAHNLVWISLDTLRRDALGRYGAPQTPFLDDLLARSLALDGHRACANWTLPGMLCQVMGRSPLDAGFFPGFAIEDSTQATPDGLETLASTLADADFNAAWLSSNLLISDALPDLADSDSLTLREHATGRAITEEALFLANIVGATDRRWSLFVHYSDTHTPYTPPEPYLGALEALAPSPVDLTNTAALQTLAQDHDDLTDEEFALVVAHLEARYAGAVQYLDDELQILWDGLEAAGLLDDTLVVVSSDHGEQLFDHDDFTHGQTLHAEEVDAVGALWHADLPATAWTGQTLAEDLGVTLVHLLGLEPLPNATGARVGTRSDETPGHAFFLGMDAVPSHALDLDGWRLLWDWEGTTSLYALGTDPGEQDDQAAQEPQVLATLQDALAPWVDQAQVAFPELTPAR
jgi:arylsulfatase A-like enzyme